MTDLKDSINGLSEAVDRLLAERDALAREVRLLNDDLAQSRSERDWAVSQRDEAVRVLDAANDSNDDYREAREAADMAVDEANEKIARLTADLERAQKPWSVTIVADGEHSRCEVIDIGHADRILLVRCDEVDRLTAEVSTLRERCGRLVELYDATLDTLSDEASRYDLLRRDRAHAECVKHNDLTQGGSYD